MKIPSVAPLQAHEMRNKRMRMRIYYDATVVDVATSKLHLPFFFFDRAVEAWHMAGIHCVNGVLLYYVRLEILMVFPCYLLAILSALCPFKSATHCTQTYCRCTCRRCIIRSLCKHVALCLSQKITYPNCLPSTRLPCAAGVLAERNTF